MSKSPHPHGKGKSLVSATIPNEVLEALDYLACKSGLSRSSYAREAIISRVTEGRLFPSQEVEERKRAKKYNTPEVISLRAAEKPTQHAPRRSAGA